MPSNSFLAVLITIVGSALAGTNQTQVRVIYEAPRSICEGEGKAYQCTPPFTNVAEGVPVVASSTCGTKGKAEEVCKLWTESDGTKRSFCETCDARNSSTSRGAERLTDRHVAASQTCWVSDGVPPGGSVNLTLSLGKRFKIFYVSLKPCGPSPDSIAIYKSSDFGRTWKPWQYFSTDCYRAFGLPTSSEHSAQISSANIQEVLCVALKPFDKYSANGQVSSVIAFNTIIGRSPSPPWSPALIDWMTMTDLQINLRRFPSKSSAIKKVHSPTTIAPQDSSTIVLTRKDRSDASFFGQRMPTTGPPVLRLGEVEQIMTQQPFFRLMQSDGVLTDTPDSKVATADSEAPVYFSFSDIAVGGRCKCNGHANRCVRDRIVEKSPSGQETIRWGPLRCDCKHNTVGVDCERCSPGHLDKPWARATIEDANVCKPCQCNNHTKNCVFDINLYRKSTGRTGGICLGCKHNTEGVNCHECISGYTRVPSNPINSPAVCTACNCYWHSNSCTFSQKFYLMSKKVSGGVCEDCQHHTTGQRCHQCADGYHRNYRVPLDHPQVCTKCRCHLIGSIENQPCDRKTGQCPCKYGVTGQQCNRCLDGYKQTRSSTTPCLKIMDTLLYKEAGTRASPPVKIQKPTIQELQCPPCETNKKRFKFKRFCRQQLVLHGTVVQIEIVANYAKVGIIVHDVWRSSEPSTNYSPDTRGNNRQNHVFMQLWVPLARQVSAITAECICPRFEIGKAYLIISPSYETSYHGRKELRLNGKSTILDWEESWRRRLKRFVKHQEAGRCEASSGRYAMHRAANKVPSVSAEYLTPVTYLPKEHSNKQASYPVLQNSVVAPVISRYGSQSATQMADEPAKPPHYAPSAYHYRSMWPTHPRPARTHPLAVYNNNYYST